MLDFLKNAAPYVGVGFGGIIVWSVLKNGVPAAYSAVKGWFSKGAADLRVLESRVAAIEAKVGVTPFGLQPVAPAPVVMPPATGPVGATGAH